MIGELLRYLVAGIAFFALGMYVAALVLGRERK